MHSSISWQHCLINAKLKLLCLSLAATAIICMAELQNLPHEQDQHPDEVTRRAHIYCADVKLFLIRMYKLIYLLKAHIKH